MSSVEERVKKIVVEQLGVKEEEVNNEASFVDDLGADSLDTVELVMALEEVLVDAALRATDQNQVRAAQLLGISRNTLRERMRRNRPEANSAGRSMTAAMDGETVGAAPFPAKGP